MDAAESSLESGHLDFAAPRAYYGGCFYVAEALLLDEGSSFSRHGSLIGEYGRLFVKTGRLDRRFHRLLIRSFTARHAADYDTDFDPDPSEFRGLIEEGEDFLEAARDYLEWEATEDR